MSETSNVKFPEITVELTGTDGNAFSILGKVTKTMRRAGVSKADREAFLKEATAARYDELLTTVFRWVNVS